MRPGQAAGAELLAIDLGTQSLRLNAYDAEGRCPWSWAAPVDSMIDGDRFEQSPAQWALLLGQGLAAAQAAGLDPTAIAVAGPLAGYVPLDAEGGPLGPAVMYPDRRAAIDLARLQTALAQRGDDGGLRATAADPLPQWLRLCREAPQQARRTLHFLDATGWLNHFLTGEATLNAYTALRLYDDTLRDAVNAADAPFGRVVAIGQAIGPLRPALAARHGFKRAFVHAATFDSKCAYLGSGLGVAGEATDISGTVSSLGVFWPRRVDDDARRIYSVPFGSGHLVRGSTAAAGSSLEWFRSSLQVSDAAALEQQARAAPAGAGGLSFLPYLSGERTPWWNAWASGAMLGLRLHTTREALARAVFEGLAYSVGHIAEVMRECGVELHNVRLAGGLARSELLCRIKADVLGVPVARLADHELTSAGLGAILAVAGGHCSDLVQASRRFARVQRWFEPDRSTQGAHQAAYQRYVAAAQALAPGFARDAARA